MRGQKSELEVTGKVPKRGDTFRWGTESAPVMGVVTRVSRLHGWADFRFAGANRETWVKRFGLPLPDDFQFLGNPG